MLPDFTRKVGFLICGAQKGGTTALYDYLEGHPDICMADKKEVHYFDVDHFFNDQPDYSKYHSFFKPKRTHKILGEATPIYMYWNDAPERIFEYNPQMKIIILLRNPIERAYSHWNMERSKGLDKLPFWDAIKSEKERCRESLPFQQRVYSYIDRGFYLKQLKRVWSFFPKESVLILKSDDLKNKPDVTIDSVCGFLQVKHLDNTPVINSNSVPYESSMSEAERNYLKSIFESEIKGIERELHWDCSDWLQE